MLERIDRGEATPIDIEIMAQVQTNIIGNCLCVLGDSMAMPIGSMIEKLRPEFEEHMERARTQRLELVPEVYSAAELAAAPHSGFDPIA
jgi:NADH-quinone oxidoreductase subunit F